MFKIHCDLDELKNLKEDVQKLSSRHKRPSPDDVEESANKREKQAQAGRCSERPDSGGKVFTSEKNLADVTEQIESFVRAMEKEAKDHPGIALLGAFVLGMVIGQLFSRR